MMVFAKDWRSDGQKGSRRYRGSWKWVMGMTDEQWKEVEKKLVPPFGRVELEIDGYKVTIVAQLVEKMKFSFVVYVYAEKIRGSQN